MYEDFFNASLFKEKLIGDLAGNYHCKFRSSKLDYDNKPLIQKTDQEVFEYFRDNISSKSYLSSDAAFEIFHKAENNEIVFRNSRWLDCRKDSDFYKEKSRRPSLFKNSNGTYDYTSYDSCYNLELTVPDSIEEEKIKIKITIYEGDNYSGACDYHHPRCAYFFESSKGDKTFDWLIRNFIRPVVLDKIAKKVIDKLIEQEYNDRLQKCLTILKNM